MAERQMAASGTPSGTDGGCSFGGVKTGSGTLASCTSTAGAFDMVGNLWEWAADPTSTPAGEFGTIYNAGAMALGQDFSNSGGGTPSTTSLFIMAGGGGVFDNGPNTSIDLLGFRCVH